MVGGQNAPMPTETDKQECRIAWVGASSSWRRAPGRRLLDVEPLKPLAKVGGEPLIRHALHAMAAAGVERATIVLGNAADAIAAALADGPIPVEARS
jgi:CTP:molybdopterin cytidylyltransferase MocA